MVAVEALGGTIADGDEGTFQTVDRMRALVNDRCAHPVIRGLAVSIVGLGTDPARQIAAIRSWLRVHVRFLPDPDTTELLHDPVLLAQMIDAQSVIGADCDDVAMLGAALGKAVGLAARFVVVGFFDVNAPLTHIWAELFDGSRWVELDTTRTAQNIEDGRITRRVNVDVATGQRSDNMQLVRDQRRIGVFPRRLGATPAVRQRQLGWVQSIPVVISTIQSITSLFQGGKEVDRINQNKQAESIALAGGPGAATATQFLKCRSGKFGLCTIEGYPDQIGGWATDSAKEDAYRRYQNVVATLGGEPTNPLGGSTVVTTPVGKAQVSNATILIGAAALFFFLRKR